MGDSLKYWSRGKPLLKPSLNTSGLLYWNRGTPFTVLPMSSGGVEVSLETISASLSAQEPTILAYAGAVVSIDAALQVSCSLESPNVFFGQVFAVEGLTISGTLQAPTVGVFASCLPESLTVNMSLLGAAVQGGATATASGLTISCSLLNPALEYDFMVSMPPGLTISANQPSLNINLDLQFEVWGLNLSASQPAPEIHPGMSITQVGPVTGVFSLPTPSVAGELETIFTTVGVTVSSNMVGNALYRVWEDGTTPQASGWVFQDPRLVDPSRYNNLLDQWANCDLVTDYPPDTTMLLIQVTNTASNKDYTFGLRADACSETRTATVYRNTSEWLLVPVEFYNGTLIFEVYVDHASLSFYVVGRCRYTNWPGPDGSTYSADKSLSTTGSYQPINLSWRNDAQPNYKWLISNPSAKAALLAVNNTGNSSYQYAVRRPDFSYDYYYDIYQNTCQLAVVGLSTNHSFDMKIENANVDCYYIGQGGSDFRILSSGPQLLPATITYSAWVDFDISTYIESGSPPVVGAILQVYNSSGSSVKYNARKNSSTTAITSPIDFYAGCQKFIMVGVDSNKIFEIYQSATGINAYLVGYITAPVFAPGYFLLECTQGVPSPQPVPPGTGWVFPKTPIPNAGLARTQRFCSYTERRDLSGWQDGYNWFEYRPVRAQKVSRNCKSLITKWSGPDEEGTQQAGHRPIDGSDDFVSGGLNCANVQYTPLNADGKCEYSDAETWGPQIHPGHWILCYQQNNDYGLQTYVEKSNTATGWQTKTASEVADGADTAFLMFRNIAPATTWCAYFAEHADCTEYLGPFYGVQSCAWMWVTGINPSKQYDQFVSDLMMDTYLQGYGKGDVHAFAGTATDPRYELAITTVNIDTWKTYSADGIVPDGASGLLLYARYDDDYYGRFRVRIDEEDVSPPKYGCYGGIGHQLAVGLDYNMEFQVFIDSAFYITGEIYVMGYFMGSKRATLWTNPQPLQLGVFPPSPIEVQQSETLSWDGWVFPTNPINITAGLTITNVWATFDLGTNNFVPVNTTAIIFYMDHLTTHEEIRVVRPTGSTYNTLCKTDYVDFFPNLVKLDSNRCFQAYVENLSHQNFYVVAYTNRPVNTVDPWQTEYIAYNPGRVLEVDTSSYTSSSAKFLVLDVMVMTAGTIFGSCLPNEVISWSSAFTNYPGWQGTFGGVTGQSYHANVFAPSEGGKFEAYIGLGAGTTFNVLYWLDNEKFYAFRTPPAITAPKFNGWQDVDVSQWLPGDATGVLLESSYFGPNAEFRKNGATASYFDYNSSPQVVVGVDRYGIFEYNNKNSANVPHFYLLGYFRGYTAGGVDAFADYLTLQASLPALTINTVTKVYAEWPGVQISIPSASVRYGVSHDPNIVTAHLQNLEPDIILETLLEPAAFTLNISLYDPLIFEGMVTQDLALAVLDPLVEEGVGVDVAALTLNLSMLDATIFQAIPVDLQLATLLIQEPLIVIPKLYEIPDALQVTSSLETPNVYGKAVETPSVLDFTLTLPQPYLPDQIIGLSCFENSLNLQAPDIMADAIFEVVGLTVNSTLYTPNVAIIFPMSSALTVSSSLQSPTTYTEASSWVFPTTWTPLIGSWSWTEWNDVQLGSSFENVKGVILHARNSSSLEHTLTFRRTFSSAARQATSQIQPGTHLWYFVPVDSNRKFDMYCSSQDIGPNEDIDIRIVGYCFSNIFLADDIDKSVSTAGTYQTVTFDDSGILADATGVFLELHNSGTSGVNQWAIRKFGTTYDSYYRGQGHNAQMIVAPVDSQRRSEMKVSSTDIDIWAWGSLATDCSFFSSPIALNLSNTSTWTDVDVSSYVPSDTIAVLLELINSSTDSVTMHVRKKGSADFSSDTSALQIPPSNHIHAFVGLNSSKVFQIIRPSTAYTIYLLGYVLGGSRQYLPMPLELGFSQPVLSFVGPPSLTVMVDTNYVSFYGAGVTSGISRTLDAAYPPVDPTIYVEYIGADTAVLHSFGAGSDFSEGGDTFACEITYSFSSDVAVTDIGIEHRFSAFSHPKREVSVSLGVVDSAAYNELQRTLILGSSLSAVPLWAFSTPLTSGATVGASQVSVADVSEFSVDDIILIVRDLDINAFDNAVVTSISGTTSGTLFLNVELENEYHAPSVTDFIYDSLSTHVAPCVVGSVELEEEDLYGNASLFLVKARVDGGAWRGAVIPTSISDFLEKPAEPKYASPKIERDLLGDTTGVLALRAYESSSRLSFTLDWHFIDDTWKTLRDVFFYSRGRSATFRMPTWKSELRVRAQSAQGSSTITVDPGFDRIWQRFNTLMVVPRYGDPFIVTLVSYTGNETFTLNASLPVTIYPGDQVSICPTVRFSEDNLEFAFKGKDKCTVSATFLEVRN